MPSDCVVSGTLIDGENNAKVGGLVIVTPIAVTGALVHGKAKRYKSVAAGAISFTAIQGAQYNIRGEGDNFILGFERSGQDVTIPASATANLADLLAVVSIPTAGLTIKDEGVALASLIGTLNVVGSGVSVVQTAAGVATMTVTASSAWGGITGTITNQTDLVAAVPFLSSSNLFTNLNTVRRNNLLATFTSGISLTNETAATALAEVQRSPLLLFKGAGWDGAANFPHYFSIGINPSGDTANLEFLYSQDGAVWSVFAQLQEDGVFFADTIQTDNLDVSAVNLGSGVSITKNNADAVVLNTTTDTDPVWLLFNGTTNLHAGIKRVGTALHVKLANDSAFAAVEALSFTGIGSGLTALNASNISTGTLDDARLSANIATKAYADSLVVGLVDDRGNFDASGNVFPSSGGSGTAGAILKGDLWTISVAGTLGGSSVTAGDLVRALVDTPGQTASNWAVTENNIGYVAENQANKATGFGTLNNTLYPTTQAVADYAQPLDAELTAIAGLVSAADRLPYFTGSGSAALATFTVFGRSLVDDADAATAQATLGLVIGTDVQGFSARLSEVVAIGTALQQIRVNAGATALEYFTPTAGIALSDSPTWTGAHTFSKNSASATPTVSLTGTWFTGGGTTNTKPHFLVEPTGTTSTGWSNNGTGIGLNADSGFVGHLIDLQKNGSFKFRVDTGGNITLAAGASIAGTQNNSFIGGAGTGRFGSGFFNAVNIATNDAGTTTVTNPLILGHQTSGTPAAGFGAGILFNLNSNGAADRNAARLFAAWLTATDASRTARASIEVEYNGEASMTEVARFVREAGAGLTGFYLWDADNGQLEQVSVGVADSGGAGFKLLRIAN